MSQPIRRPIAVGAEPRTRGFTIESMLQTLDRVVDRNARELAVLIYYCDDERLQRRYIETRRPHPLAGSRPVIDGIGLECTVVSPLRDRADLVIDTSNLTTAELKCPRTSHFDLDAIALRIFVTSSFHPHGIPRDVDLIFDVRSLDNPHYITELRPLTGRGPEVRAYTGRDQGCKPFCSWHWRLLEPLLARYAKESEAYLTIAGGGAGGRPRSASATERLGTPLRGGGMCTELSRRDRLRLGSPEPVPPGAPTLAG